MPEITHETLPCGIEYAVMPLPDRHIATFQIRVLAGTALEAPTHLGVAQLVEETITKGTAKRSGRDLSDAIDAIGAGCHSGTGRETTTFTCTVLPDHFEKALELHAEFLTTATFPQDAFDVNVSLAKQELVAIEDDAHALADRLLDLRAWGPLLGRHPLGESETLERITRDDVVNHWRTNFQSGGILVAVAGCVDAGRVEAALQRLFDGFGDGQRMGRDALTPTFQPGRFHLHKDLQQQQIGIGWPAVDATHDAFPTQQVMLGILSGGMGSRLFTEVREKQGLVYWVSAWQETPRESGMVFLGASTTPERCDQTYTTLLREVDRLSEDLTMDKLNRAKTGIVAGQETKGDTTRAHGGDLCNDLFFYGKPVATEEKIAKIEAVTIDDVKAYLGAHPRDQLCVVTVGPRELATNDR